MPEEEVGIIDDAIVSYRPMNRADLSGVVDVHLEVFPGYFLTLMGRRFVGLYYAQYLDHPHGYAILAVRGNEVVGFIFGGRDIASLERRFYRRHLLTLGTIVAARFVTSSEARSSILERSKVIRSAVASLLPAGRRRVKRKKPRPDSGRSVGPVASIMSTAVRRSARGTGVGGRLQRAFQEMARVDGSVAVIGTVKRENEAHVERKTKHGWRIVSSDDKKVTFGLDIVPVGSGPSNDDGSDHGQ